MKDLKTKVEEVIYIYTKMKKGTSLEEIGRLLNGYDATDIAIEVEDLIKKGIIIDQEGVISMKLS